MSAFVRIPESRRAARRSVEIDCDVVATQSDTLTIARCSDLSPFGMSLETDLVLEADDVVAVSFAPPYDEPEMTLFARVKRSVLDLRSGQRNVGLEFVRVASFERHALRNALRGIPPRFPGRLRSGLQPAAV